jgi:hypothetical protein
MKVASRPDPITRSPTCISMGDPILNVPTPKQYVVPAEWELI